MAWTRGPTLATPRLTDGGPPPLPVLQELKKGNTKSSRNVTKFGAPSVLSVILGMK